MRKRCPPVDHHANYILVMVNSRGPKLHTAQVEMVNQSTELHRNRPFRIWEKYQKKCTVVRRRLFEKMPKIGWDMQILTGGTNQCSEN